MRSGVMRPHSGLIHSGQRSYQVATRRHCDFGFSVMTVSIIESGAGSVGVSARPAFPSTRSTSGNRIRMRSCIWSSRPASAAEIPGSVVGMNSSAPSSSGGMNSDPSPRYTGTVTTTNATAPASTSHFQRRSTRPPAAYSRISTRLMGCFSSE
jgi:hypothetical protein